MISVKEKQSIYIGGIDNEKNNGVDGTKNVGPRNKGGIPMNLSRPFFQWAKLLQQLLSGTDEYVRKRATNIL